MRVILPFTLVSAYLTDENEDLVKGLTCDVDGECLVKYKLALLW